LAAAAITVAGCSSATSGGNSVGATGRHAKVSLTFKVNTGLRRSR